MTQEKQSVSSTLRPPPSNVAGTFDVPPVVAVLGHVDHGKTSLLDFIRKTTVAAKEHGGITQHIGAYQVQVKSSSSAKASADKENSKVKIEEEKFITFIDTPGHEAFAKMRSRGATAADIAILVVAADDSVKPQTIESIHQIKAANIPMIVAINKIDLEAANVQKVKQDLAKHEVQVEGFGGEVPWVGVSAKTGKGIPELLDTILLVWELKLHSEPLPTNTEFSGNVIETNIDKGRGMVASVVVKTGTLSYGMKLFEDDRPVGKVRAMIDEWGSQVKAAPPGKPIQVLGFDILPHIGAVIRSTPLAKTSPPVVPQETEPQPYELPDFLKPVSEIKKTLSIALKVDTAGSQEAIKASLPDNITVVSESYGDITEADVLEAKANNAFIVGFNVGIKGTAVKLAETEKVVYRTYTIIYELINELTEVAVGMQEITTGEREVGTGEILASFPFEKQQVAGIKVTSGRLAKGDWVRIMQRETEVGRARIKSVRQGKLDVTKVEEGGECGVLFDKPVAFSVGDDIIAVIK